MLIALSIKSECYVLVKETMLCSQILKMRAQSYLIKSIVGSAELNNALAGVFWLHHLHGNMHEQIFLKHMNDLF